MDKALLKAIEHLEKITPTTFDSLVRHAQINAITSAAICIAVLYASYAACLKVNTMNRYDQEPLKVITYTFSSIASFISMLILQGSVTCLLNPTGYVLNSLLLRLTN